MFHARTATASLSNVSNLYGHPIFKRPLQACFFLEISLLKRCLCFSLRFSSQPKVCKKNSAFIGNEKDLVQKKQHHLQGPFE